MQMFVVLVPDGNAVKLDVISSFGRSLGQLGVDIELLDEDIKYPERIINRYLAPAAHIISNKFIEEHSNENPRIT